MAAIVAELRPRDRPFGVDTLWDPMAAMALAKATGASFMREVLTGAYESDMGIWSPDGGAVLPYRSQVDADNVLVMGNITPEFASPLGSRSVAHGARSAVTSSLLDVVLIAGTHGRRGAGPQAHRGGKTCGRRRHAGPHEHRRAGRQHRPLPRGYRWRHRRIRLKVDGKTWNPVDPARAAAFMDRVPHYRSTLR